MGDIKGRQEIIIEGKYPMTYSRRLK